MSSPLTPDERAFVAYRAQTLRVYAVISGLMLAGIAGLVVYSIRLGPLIGPGVNASFGYAVALMFLMGTVLIHLVDRLYRVYPFGRRLHPSPPPPIGDAEIAVFLRVVLLVAVVGALGYILGSLIAT